MAMNIKSPEAERLARELSGLTGENLTAAVTRALRAEVERVRREQSRKGLAERLLAIGRDCAKHMNPPLRSSEIDDLYDERGLPR
jgi:antitoxin VapB